MLLVALWLLAWGDVSLANIVSGVAVAPRCSSRSRRAGVPVGPTGCACGRGAACRLHRRAARYVERAHDREILRPRFAVRPGVLEAQLRQPSDEVVTVMTNVIALSPGTMTVDVEPDSSAIYVHFLFLRDVAASRAVLARLEEFASARHRGPARLPYRSAKGADMTEATFVILTFATVLFMYRLCAGPSLADRVVALNGAVIVGMGAIANHAAHTGVGAFLPTLVAVALVGPISNGMIARFIEARKQ